MLVGPLLASAASAAEPGVAAAHASRHASQLASHRQIHTGGAVASPRRTMPRAARPTVTGLSPKSGTVGSEIIITGTGFTGATIVDFGTLPTAYQVVSPTEITAVSNGVAGTKAGVTVTTSGGKSASSSGANFTFTAGLYAPFVSSLDPVDGPAATTITILGSGFSGATAVHFGTVSATSFKVVSDSEMTAKAPAGTKGFEVHVTVTTKLGTSYETNEDLYGYHVVAKSAAPFVSYVAPATGPASGGEPVLIEGPSFSGVTGVKFGPTAAASFAVLTDTSLLAISPPGAAGTSVDITVKSAAGTSVTYNGDEFTYAPLPTVTSVSPSSGSTAGGTTVTITGTGFTSLAPFSCLVAFGPFDCATRYHIVSGTKITAVAPGGTPGVIDVLVTTADGRSFGGSADHFTFVEPKPTLTNVSPAYGPTAGGIDVYLSGTGYTDATSVKFGGHVAKFTVESDGSILAIAPSGSAGPVQVSVTSPKGTSASNAGDVFTYLAPPTVTGVSPSAGPQSGGTAVTLTGTGFSEVANVEVGGNSASFTILSSTKISVSSPAGPAKAVDVVVANPGGTSAKTTKDQFTYSSGAPTVNALFPDIGSTAGVTGVEISGSGFSATSKVEFGGTSASVVEIASSTAIYVTAPKHALGTVTVQVISSGGTSSVVSPLDQFSYVAAPTVTGVSVNSGPTTGGSTVTITGNGFLDVTAVNFGNGPYSAVPLGGYSVGSAETITAEVPSQAVGTVNVTVTAAGGSSASVAADHYTYKAAVASVASVSPNSGPTSGGIVTSYGVYAGADVVDITGAGFADATAVDFGGVAGHFTVEDANDIEATPPPGSAQTVDITVVDATGTSRVSGADEYTYLAPPTVTSLTPNSGPTAGANTVLVKGSGFSECRFEGENNCTVDFGSTRASSFSVLSNTEISVVVEPGAAGTVNVSVTSSAGTSPVAAGDVYRFTPAVAPTVEYVTPASGPITGGTVVEIIGAGFTTANAVDFGSVAAAGFAPQSDFEILAVAPPGVAKTVDIRVTNALGTSAVNSSDEYTYTPAVTVTSLSPGSGPSSGGTTVTISGMNLSLIDYVYFDSSYLYFNVNSSGTRLTFLTPAEAPETIDVFLYGTSGDGFEVSGGMFTYLPSRPVVSGVSPAGGPVAGAMRVFITGTGFSAATAVKFGTALSQSFSVNGPGTAIDAVAPAGTAGATVNVTVTNAAGTSAPNPSDQFEYIAGPPTITSITNDSGPTTGGTLVTIHGTDLTDVSAVAFGQQYLFDDSTEFLVNTATSITALSPPGDPGGVDITVISPAGRSATSGADRFTYVAAPPVVETIVTDFFTTSGPGIGGTLVEIDGENFDGASAVRFGTTEAIEFHVTSRGNITAVSPPGSGTVDITVTTPAGTSATSSADQFVYYPAPTVTGLSTITGSTDGGTSLTITGTNLLNASTVEFGSADAIVDSDSATSITVNAPAYAPGTVDVTVTTPGGTSSTSSKDQFTYDAVAPTVTSFYPAAGPLTGGTSVSIFGSSLSGATTVHFGAVAGLVQNVSPDGSFLTAVDPAEGAGPVSLTVTTPAGTSPASSGQFVYTPAPTVTSLTGNKGSTAGGTTVTIHGTNLTGGSVNFGSNAAANITSSSATSITAVSPSGAPGVVDVTVTTAGGTSATVAADRFTYQLASPAVTSVDYLGYPRGSTFGGEDVTVDGSSFFGVTKVVFGTTPVVVINVDPSGSYLNVVAPAAAAGPVNVRVTTSAGESAVTSKDAFTDFAPPTVTSLNVSHGATVGGTTVTIHGTNLAFALDVDFGTQSAEIISDGATSITVKSPLGDTALVVDVTVTTVAGRSPTSPADLFTYLPAAPVISPSGLSSTAGPTSGGGLGVTISGQNLFAITSVDFGSTPASISDLGGTTSLVVIVPAHTAGPVKVTVKTAYGTSNGETYTYVAPPAVTSLTGSNGSTAGGTTVIIHGTNLSDASYISFGTLEVSYSTDTATSITVLSPAQPAGVVDVTVTTLAGGTSATVPADRFTYNPTAPTLTNVTNNSTGTTEGSTLGGTEVSLLGSSFFGVTAVDFGTSPGTITYVSSDGTTMNVTAPAHAAGAVNVTVTNATGTSPPVTFTYLVPPAVTATLSPTSGSTAGGTTVTITGTNLSDPETSFATVQFGTVEGSVLTVSNTQITVQSPSEAPGVVDVTVTTSGGTSAITPKDEFTFNLGAPAVTGLSQSSGPVAGGTSLYVFGSSFFDVTAVDFGSTAGTITSVDPGGTYIEVTSPPHAGGVVDVRVVNSAGKSPANPPGDQFTYS